MVEKKLRGISSQNVLLYGAGFRGQRVSQICPDLFKGFVDGDLKNKVSWSMGLRCIHYLR